MIDSGLVAPSGSLGLTIIRRSQESERLAKMLRDWQPGSDLGKMFMEQVFPHIPARVAADFIDKLRSIFVAESQLAVKVIRATGEIEDHGVVGRKVVTDVAVASIVDAFQGAYTLSNFKYHGLGTGSTAEAAGDTDLVTELTTEYATDNTRPTGTTTEGATANIFETVATNTLDGTPGAALREHGVFSAAAVASGDLLDRTVFAALTLSSGDAVQSTYQLTLTSGS